MNEHAGEITALTLALMPLCHLTEPQTGEHRLVKKESFETISDGNRKDAATLLMLNKGTVQLCMKTLSLFTQSRVFPNLWNDSQ